MEREYQIAMKSQKVIGNLPPAVEPAAATPLRHEPTSLQFVMLDDAAQGVRGNNLLDNASKDDQAARNPPPLLRRLDKITSAGDIGMDFLPKSANSGFPKVTRNRNLLLSNDKRSQSSGVIESVNKRKTSPGLFPQEITMATKGSSLPRQSDGIRLPPVVSVGTTSHDATTKVKTLPGMHASGGTGINSAKSIPEMLNTRPPSSVSKRTDGSKSLIRTPPSMFGSSPVIVGKRPQQQTVANTPQFASSPPQHSIPHGKPITTNQHQLQREVVAVKSETSLSHFNDVSSSEQRKAEAKSPSSVSSK